MTATDHAEDKASPILTTPLYYRLTATFGGVGPLVYVSLLSTHAERIRACDGYPDAISVVIEGPVPPPLMPYELASVRYERQAKSVPDLVAACEPYLIPYTDIKNERLESLSSAGYKWASNLLALRRAVSNAKGE